MSSSRPLKQSRTIIILLVLAALIAGIALWARKRGLSFDFASFSREVRQVSWGYIALGIGLIYASYLIRSYRWAVFIRKQRSVAPLFLLGPQFTGFTAVAIFGRIADLSRPYLVARKANLSLPSQIAVYTIERMFDLGAAALIFSSALAFTPTNMPHHDVFVRVGVASLLGTLVLAAFAVAIRVAGEKVAVLLGGISARLSPKLGRAVEEKVLAFRDGLHGIASVGEALWAGVLSIAQWMCIAFAYVATTHAFVAEPTLAHLSFPSTMLLMGASIGSSVLQLPVLGWFTQIAATAASMHAFYGTPLETATACGALLLCVTFLCIIPTGLVYARVDRVSLSDLRSRETPAEVTR